MVCRPGEVCSSRIHFYGLSEWHVNAANASALAETLRRERDQALLFRTLAPLRTDIARFGGVDQLGWHGPTSAFAAMAATRSMSCHSQTSFQGGAEILCLSPIRTDAGVCDDGGVGTGGMRLTVAIHGS